MDDTYALTLDDVGIDCADGDMDRDIDRDVYHRNENGYEDKENCDTNTWDHTLQPIRSLTTSD